LNEPSQPAFGRWQPAAPAQRPAADELVGASDVELAQALLANAPGAHHAAWQRFSPLIVGMVRRSSGRELDTDDVVQEVFLCLFRRIHTLRDPLALRAFVMAITTRTLSFELRKRRNRERLAGTSGEDVDDVRLTYADPAASYALIVLRQLVGRLRKRERRAFVLRYVEGMNADEVARALGVSTPTARRSFSRAWRRVALWARRDPLLTDYLQGS
jgi:RNA polymerase sigma-70 factor, ECF subfamily